jgi:hypothetical protein
MLWCDSVRLSLSFSLSLLSLPLCKIDLEEIKAL